ncbi:MAG: hypothetical protein U9Q69_02760 [Nanoarchaeota archaeon]|nr:hypothetical protein [Nanoarchaeota archaeon]
MKKRGQIYLLVALVIGVVIFGLVTVTNKVQQESLKSDFEKLSKNYARESSRLINSLIGKKTEEEIAADFMDFTMLFTGYSKTQSPEFGLIYVFKYGDILYIGNYLDEELKISCEGCDPAEAILTGCYEKIPASVEFEGLSFDMGIDINDLKTEGCIKEITAPEGNLELGLEIAEVPYLFNIREDHPEVIMVSWESHKNQRKVFTEGDLSQK